MNLIKDMLEDWPGRILLGLTVLLILAIPVMIKASIEEQKQWEAFKVEHDCRVVGHEKGHTSTGVGPVTSGNGGVAVIVTTTPDKTGWLCDDGITYWR